MRTSILFLILISGCIIEQNSPPPQCVGGSSYEIDTGATIDHAAGIDAGYYVSYGGAGNWHFDWTCDTKLSAAGCNFTGSIVGDRTTTANCFQCESEDALSVTPSGSQTVIQFDTITSTGLDGVDIATTPGSALHIDLQINGLYQDDLVFLPSGGQTTTPTCMPIDLVPSSS